MKFNVSYRGKWIGCFSAKDILDALSKVRKKFPDYKPETHQIYKHR